jgi:hypothetical protein
MQFCQSISFEKIKSGMYQQICYSPYKVCLWFAYWIALVRCAHPLFLLSVLFPCLDNLAILLLTIHIWYDVLVWFIWCLKPLTTIFQRIYHQIKIKIKIKLCRDRMVIRFITTYAINAYLLSPLTLWVRILLKLGVLDTTLCDKVYQWLVAGRWIGNKIHNFFQHIHNFGTITVTRRLF